MNFKFEVENIKCGGCASTIKKRLMEDDSINDVMVDVESGTVTISSEVDASEKWREQLLKLGYPQAGTAEGMASAKAKAKSFVSCAVGRVDQALNK